MRLVPVALCLLLSVPTHAGTWYRWIDAEGEVHFSDAEPPPGASGVRMQHTPSGQAGRAEGVRPGERRLLREAEQRRERQLGQRRAARRKWHQGRARRTRACRETRQELRSLDSLRSGSEQRRRLLRRRRELRCLGGPD